MLTAIKYTAIITSLMWASCLICSFLLIFIDLPIRNTGHLHAYALTGWILPALCCAVYNLAVINSDLDKTGR